VRFLLKWLRSERPAGVALHPTRTLELELPPDEVFERALRGTEHTLGGIIRDCNRQLRTFEATFGLINSERLTITVQPLETQRTRVIIESRRFASGQVPSASHYVEVLADYLRC
jgi:hypothetical protein